MRGAVSPCAWPAGTIGGVRFLLHGKNLSPAVGVALSKLGHSVEPLDAPVDPEPTELLKHCHVKQLDLITDDPDLARAAVETPVKFDRCVVFLQLAGGEVEQDDAVERLFQRYKRLSPRKLYTVTETRVKVRQLPGGA